MGQATHLCPYDVQILPETFYASKTCTGSTCNSLSAARKLINYIDYLFYTVLFFCITPCGPMGGYQHFGEACVSTFRVKGLPRNGGNVVFKTGENHIPG